MTFCRCKDTIVKTEEDTWDGLDLVAVDDCYWCFVSGCSSVIITYISALESWLYNSSHHIVWQGTTLLLCLDRLSALFPCEMCRFYAHLNTRRVQRVVHVSWTVGKYVWLRYRVCLWNLRSSQLLEMFFFFLCFLLTDQKTLSLHSFRLCQSLPFLPRLHVRPTSSWRQQL